MIDDPNVVLPLATSYNERGVAGFTHTVTNSEDQRKINCFYELVSNHVTGKGTLTNSKRPGVAARNAGTYGSSTQNVYLVINADVASGSETWLINKSGNDSRASSGIDGTILNSGLHFPVLVDKTAISSVEQIVVQLRQVSPATAHRVFFAAITDITTWTEITDADFTALIHYGKMEHLDGFAFILTSTNKIFNSDTNSLANWVNTSFITKQIVQDAPVGLAKLNNQILAFGENTVEVFYNAGNTVGSPLGRIPQLHHRIGLIAPDVGLPGGHYYAVIGRNLYFVGQPAGGSVNGRSASAYVYDGSAFTKISTPYIDKILSQVSNSPSYYSINSMSFSGQPAIGILLTSPNATSQRWLMFFPEWKEWFEWTSTIFSSINSGNGLFLPCSTGNKATLYAFPSTDIWQDDGTSYPWTNQFKLPANGSSRKRMVMYGVDADTDTSANSISVEVSDNDCASFYSLQDLDLTKEKKIAFRGGAYTKRHVRLSKTDARPKRIHNFIANVVN